MAPLLRRKLACFYCGGRSAQSYSKGLQRWQCESCGAVNHLDGDGGIIEPPADASSSPQRRYAYAIRRSVSPELTPLDNSLFCKICLKNQHLITTNLSDYFPAPDDPRHAEFEQTYPEYKKNLEERYPIVCEQCWPKAKERILLTGYAAKTDHLRRMMEKTRGIPLSYQYWNKKRLASHIGLLCWLMAFITQTVWNGLGAVSLQTDGLRTETEDISASACVRQMMEDQQIQEECVLMARPTAFWGLVLGLSCIWWNPIMPRKPLERVVGLSEFYRMQFVLGIARLVSWYLLRNDREPHLDTSATRALHAIMLVFNVAVTIVSYRSTYRIPGPHISFNGTQDDPVFKNASATSLGATQFAMNRQNEMDSQPVPATTQFPVSSLNPALRAPVTPTYHPPTPPPEDDPDAMDLDTPYKNVQLGRSIHVHQPTPVRPSPFHGRLPEAPVSQERKLRNPQNPPALRRISTEQKENFSSRLSKTNTNATSMPSIKPSESPRNYQMSEPTFFAPESIATGLENLFSGTVSLDNDPPELRKKIDQEKSESYQIRVWTIGSVIRRSRYRLLSFLLLMGASEFWDRVSALSPHLQSMARFACLGIAAAVAGQHLISALSPARPFWVLSDALMLCFEILCAMVLGVQLQSATRSSELHNVQESLGSIPRYYFWFMAFQEAAAVLIDLRNARTAAQAAKLMQSFDDEVKYTQRLQPPLVQPRKRSPLPIESALAANPQTQSSVPSGGSFSSDLVFPNANGLDRGFGGYTGSISRALRDSPGASTSISGLSIGGSPSENFSRIRPARKTSHQPPWQRGGL